MNQLPIPSREEQALREIGRTRVAAWVAWSLTGLFLLTIVSVPLLEPWYRWRQTREGESLTATAALLGPLPRLVRGVAESGRVAREQGLFAANHALLETLDEFETRLEDESFLRSELLPPTQELLTRRFGLGNEQAYVGRDGWLFYRPDIDYATAPGFLDTRVLVRRSRAGNVWNPPPQPDPIAALTHFHHQLAERGIRLLVLPTPVKPAIHPEAFAGHAAGAAPRNPSWREFATRLTESGIEVVDADPLLRAARQAGSESLYLHTDTHWTPEAMQLVAREVARVIQELVVLGPPSPDGFFRRSAIVEGQGDIVAMLHLPKSQDLFGTERVTVSPVLSGTGDAWRPDTSAEVLLLGDSFTNIYSQTALGWGAGAGLAEQITYNLGRPVDRIAMNAGGSHTTRQALARALATGDDRLAGKKIVVYQFADRELVGGDWKLIDLP